jgi:hypothetical protein
MLSSAFLAHPSDHSRLSALIQHHFDEYFDQVGPTALTPPDTTDAHVGSPLGSWSVFELERGLNHLLQGYGLQVVVLKRPDGMLKVIVCDPGEQASSAAVWQAEHALSGIEWMGWQQLEEKEAEILTSQLDESLRIGN